MLKKKIPEWLATTLSFILVGAIFLAYFVSRDSSALPKPEVSSDSEASTDSATAPAFAHPLAIGGAHLMVAYASTAPEQEQGLSGTDSLPAGEGMLFIFPSDTQIPFWMKDMNYPIDIIWIGNDKTVKDIAPDLAPSTYPNSYYGPKVPVRYALEVPAGFAKQNFVREGTKVSF